MIRKRLLPRRPSHSQMRCVWFAVFFLLIVGIFSPVAGGQLSADQNSLDEAIEQAKQKAAADPTSAKAQVTLGDLLLTKGSLDEAEKAFEAALSLNAGARHRLAEEAMRTIRSNFTNARMCAETLAVYEEVLFGAGAGEGAAA